VSPPNLSWLAREVGIAVNWTNAAGERRRVSPDTLRHILKALGFACDTPAELAESCDRIRAERASRPPRFITAEAGREIAIELAGSTRGKLLLEDGSEADVTLKESESGSSLLPAIAQPGYHQFLTDEVALRIAVAPARCFAFADAAQNRGLWGLSAQVYGLRRPGDGGIGDTTSVGQLAQAAAAHGADAIALSPMHALFSAQPCKFSPYSPSHRLMLNPLLADPASLFGSDFVTRAGELPARIDALESLALIDWPEAAAQKLALLRQLFENFLQGDQVSALMSDFCDFRRSGADLLERHARFEALQAELMSRDPKAADWRNWTPDLRDPASAEVAAFARMHEREVLFHIFLQWMADRALAEAQARSKQAGMRIGLIADLAVGTEASGSEAWACQGDLLLGLSVGAPPDAFNPDGQNWGLTSLSPQALLARDFEPFLATLRTLMRHAGGVRIDHVMGLRRLWVIPAATSSNEGAYLAYPFDDLLRLIRLESFRNRAIIIGEDLGTVPAGFRKILAEVGIAGMDVLWFARKDGEFLPPNRWRRDALAMTSTHDLPTIAGWWKGKDIAVRKSLGLLAEGEGQKELRHRAQDREDLSDAFQKAGVSPEPSVASPVDAAIAFVAKTPAPLALIPLEDMLGLEEQPNLPGTIDQYPNWRRRYPCNTHEIFDDPAVSARAETLANRHTP